MRITIDYSAALRQQAGIGRYTRGLVTALAEMDQENEYTLFCAGAVQPTNLQWPANYRFRTTAIPVRWLDAAWQHLSVPIPAEQLAGDCDIFHSPNFTLPPLSRARGVVTVHDLSFLRVPECADPRLRRFLERAVPRSVMRAVRVLADSHSTRRDLIELLQVPPERISVVSPGVEPRFHPVRDTAHLAKVRERYRLPAWFVLSVGTLEPRKNFPALISAYAQMRRQTGLPHALVIAGQRGWLYDAIFERVRREGLSEDVHFLGFVADEDLPALYTLADLFVFPSLYEGFGLPVVEALACGTPAVVSDNSSLPEAAGNAALLVPTGDVDSLADAMARVLGNANLRVRLADMGRAQAARLTWRRSAEALLEAYRLAMAT